jgi:ATP-binding protein involved in chromosome partitioning
MPPGTGDIQITLGQSASLSGAVIVTTPHTLSLADAAKGALSGGWR